MLNKIIQFLDGKKTYIQGVLGLCVLVGYYFGVVDAKSAGVLLTLFGLGGMISLRAAVSKGF